MAKELKSLMSSQLWKLVQDWYDSQRVQPSWAKVAEELEVSQSTFETWKQPVEFPTRRTLWLIHDLTKVPFEDVVNAAIESVDLFNPERARIASEVKRASRRDSATSRAAAEARKRRDTIGEESQDTEGFDPA